jgi:hypothetical protein
LSVVAFGLLTTGQWFGDASDVDLAAAIRTEGYFTAAAALQGLLGEFAMDLVVA